MSINEHLVIKLRIGGQEYPLRIKRETEKIYRDAAVEIERKVGQYRNRFLGADTRKLEELDYVIMASVQAISEYNDLEEQNRTFEDKIKEMTKELDNYLKSI